MERTWALQNPQASSQSKVTCELPARGPKGMDWYTMSFYVDGLKVQGWVPNVVFKRYKTPMVSRVSTPRYVKVNSMVGFGGTIFTDAYGNTGEAEGNALDNDNPKVELVSAFVGPKECELVGEACPILVQKYLYFFSDG